jgi:hypothetical protein
MGGRRHSHRHDTPDRAQPETAALPNGFALGYAASPAQQSRRPSPNPFREENMLNVNAYFDGKVKSIGFENSEGRVTAGVMAPGEYEFGTSENELMKVVSGELIVKLPGAENFESFPSGAEFNVAAKQKFQLKVEQATAYLCFYS